MPGPNAQTAPSRDLILANHQFPGEYMIKAFGPGGGDFFERVTACAHAVIDAARVAPSQRSTRSGAKICVTLTLHVERVEEIEAIYAEIHALDDLMLIL